MHLVKVLCQPPVHAAVTNSTVLPAAARDSGRRHSLPAASHSSHHLPADSGEQQEIQQPPATHSSSVLNCVCVSAAGTLLLVGRIAVAVCHWAALMQSCSSWQQDKQIYMQMLEQHCPGVRVAVQSCHCGSLLLLP
jgi:hypothetical protein